MGNSTIQIADLRVVCDRIFDFILNDLRVTTIDVDEALYWTLPTEARHDMSHPPVPEHVGNLIDDYEFVRAAVGDKDQAVPLLLQHLSPLLDELSTKVRSFR
jgi:hypothetical protein